MAQLSPSIAEMEKERLRKAREDAAPKISVGDVAAATAARKSDRVLAYEADCAAKKAVACFELGDHFRLKNGRTPQDAVDERTAYGLACQLNHGQGCYKFGEMHETGMRAARDPRMALNVYGRACKLGFSSGCYSAAKLLSSGRSPVPAEQEKQAQTVQALYKAGCDLKHYYACKAIGLAPPEAASPVTAAKAPSDPETAYLASLGLDPATLKTPAFRPSQIKPSDTGYLKYGAETDAMAAMVEKINRERRSAQIDAAVGGFEKKAAAQGFIMVQKSYVLQKLNKHQIPLNTSNEYQFFVACNEYCKNVTANLEYIADSGGQGFKSDANGNTMALTRSFEFTPKRSETYVVNVRAICLDETCTKGAAAQLVVFRRPKQFDIEAVPTRP